MSTADNQKSEPPLASNVPHHAATKSLASKPDPFPTFSHYLAQSPTQLRRAPSSIDLSSSMDAHSSFSSQELAVHPDDQPGVLLNLTSSQFTPTFQSFGNIQGMESSGGGAAGDNHVPKFVVIDNLLDRYDAPLLFINPLSCHSRGSARITLRVRQHGFHLDRFHTRLLTSGSLQSHAYHQRRS